MLSMPTLLILGARNLGAAIAGHFATRDWNVAAVARSEETLATLRERIPGALGVAADATDPDQVARAAEQAREQLGSLDLIVNAVSPGMRSQGQFGGGPLLESTPEDFEHYAVQVARQSYAFLSAGARALRDAGGGGTLIQITGGSSRRALAGKGPWAAGAFASRALTQAAALELRDHGIHAALLIVDATIRSPKTAAYTGDAQADGLAEQEDVAAAVDYLASQSPSAWTHELTLTPRGDRFTP
jgi:NAD(P)-dependent dehydrogenase (short-subunit alcohol dehydrogenase family)